MDFRGLQPASAFLERLLDLVFPPRGAEKLVREAREENVLALAAPRVVPFGHDASPQGAMRFSAVAIARFRTPLMRALVHAAKYRANARAQTLLAALLAKYLDEWIESMDEMQRAAPPRAASAIFLVPIPLSRTRMRERGFNQCEVIARGALARLASAHTGARPAVSARAIIALAPQLLERVRDTEHQTALTRAGRAANVAGAFAVPAALTPLDPNALYIVFDDVLTTGATLEAALAALRAAGAARFFPLALAD